MATQIEVWINKIRLGVEKGVENLRKAKIYNRDSSQYCIENGFVAIGYIIDDIKEDATWKIYEERLRKNKNYDKNDLKVIKSFHGDPKRGDLCYRLHNR